MRIPNETSKADEIELVAESDDEDSVSKQHQLTHNKEIFKRISKRRYCILEDDKPEVTSFKLQEESKECVICMDPISRERGILDCNHSYCRDCIQNWTKETNACPICKIKSKLLRIFVGNCFMKSEFIEDKELKIEEELNELDIIVMNADSSCYKCNSSGNENVMLICNHCDTKCCHIFCLNPPLHFIPEDDWFCDYCVRSYNIQTNNPTAGIFNRIPRQSSRSRRSKKRINESPDESLNNFIVKDSSPISSESIDSDNSIFYELTESDSDSFSDSMNEFIEKKNNKKRKTHKKRGKNQKKKKRNNIIKNKKRNKRRKKRNNLTMTIKH
jgi:hypothetical protein